MQSILTDKKTESRSFLSFDDKAVFLLCCLTVLLSSALVSVYAPIAFSVATVFLFAGPHNWIELRYFLSRLPSRFGPMRAFFCSSFLGVFVLGVGYATLIALARAQAIEYEAAISFFQIWIFLLHAWIAALLVSRRVHKRRQGLPVLQLFLTVVSWYFSLQAPLLFGLALVYLHPLVGLRILDRELRRSRPTWVAPYRAVLACAAAVLFSMVSTLLGSPSLETGTKIVEQITHHAGSYLLPDISTHLLVSVHAYLEMLHYAVWLIAIPIACKAWENKRWQPEGMPVSRDSDRIKKTISAVFITSSVAVLALWLAFLGDYSSTRDLYFTVAVFHILAEIPFLLWML